ncbi:ATP-binding cassette domain-containing protein [Campylobacter showae]|uniref:ATP-binding cassette domain-containing protein n=1 Tax=Campylobacter showae TaxID=204 RepID=UPI0013D62184|nr:ABC transporter ATP-binding protein/permease [Campylobacter showae]
MYLLEEISLAVLAASLVILSRLAEPFSVFSFGCVGFDLIDNSFAKVKEILRLEELKFDEPLSKPGAFDVKFENVNFAYENTDKPALKNINFHLPSGSLTALVGASGSGKTTITRLIMRYADANAGDIKIGDVNIKI